MKIIQASLASFLLLASTLPARADFKYTETSQMTGGSMLSMMKFASKFARGDAKKQEKDMLQPSSTTHYVKGDRLRTDNEDGTSQIIDVGGRRERLFAGLLVLRRRRGLLFARRPVVRVAPVTRAA